MEVHPFAVLENLIDIFGTKDKVFAIKVDKDDEYWHVAVFDDNTGEMLTSISTNELTAS